MLDHSFASPGPTRKFTILSLWALGAALRLLFVWLEPSTSPVADETMWLMALSRIPAAHFSPFSNYPIFHPPLYPFLLATVHELFGSLLAVKIVQALVGSLLIPAVFLVGARVFGPRTATTASFATAVYPELIWYASHFWCETLFLSLFWWAIERLTEADRSGSRRAAVAAGALFGLAILTRETLLYLLPIALFWVAFSRPRRPSLAGLVLIAALAVAGPWTLRNWIQFGAFIPVSTGGGLNLYQGNALLSRDEVYGEYYAREGKVEQFQWARAAGIKAIWNRQPAWAFEKIRDEGPRLFEVDSLALIHLRRGAYGDVSCAAYRRVAAILLVPWLLIGTGTVMALPRLSLRRGHLLLLGLLVAYLLLHIATHGFSRYRLPVLPVFVLLAASLTEVDSRAIRTWRRGLLRVGLAISLSLLWAPSLLDQLGHTGLVAPPGYEGFLPLCPLP